MRQCFVIYIYARLESTGVKCDLPDFRYLHRTKLTCNRDVEEYVVFYLYVDVTRTVVKIDCIANIKLQF